MRQKSGDLHPYQRAENYPAYRISKPPKAFSLNGEDYPHLYPMDSYPETESGQAVS